MWGSKIVFLKIILERMQGTGFLYAIIISKEWQHILHIRKTCYFFKIFKILTKQRSQMNDVALLYLMVDIINAYFRFTWIPVFWVVSFALLWSNGKGLVTFLSQTIIWIPQLQYQFSSLKNCPDVGIFQATKNRQHGINHVLHVIIIS